MPRSRAFGVIVLALVWSHAAGASAAGGGFHIPSGGGGFHAPSGGGGWGNSSSHANSQQNYIQPRNTERNSQSYSNSKNDDYHYATPQYAPQNNTQEYAAPRFSAPQQSAPQYIAPRFSAPRQMTPQYSTTPKFASPSFSAPKFSSPNQLGQNSIGTLNLRGANQAGTRFATPQAITRESQSLVNSVMGSSPQKLSMMQGTRVSVSHESESLVNSISGSSPQRLSMAQQGGHASTNRESQSLVDSVLGGGSQKVTVSKPVVNGSTPSHTSDDLVNSVLGNNAQKLNSSVPASRNTSASDRQELVNSVTNPTAKTLSGDKPGALAISTTRGATFVGAGMQPIDRLTYTAPIGTPTVSNTGVLAGPRNLVSGPTNGGENPVANSAMGKFTGWQRGQIARMNLQAIGPVANKIRANQQNDITAKHPTSSSAPSLKLTSVKIGSNSKTFPSGAKDTSTLSPQAAGWWAKDARNSNANLSQAATNVLAGRPLNAAEISQLEQFRTVGDNRVQARIDATLQKNGVNTQLLQIGSNPAALAAASGAATGQGVFAHLPKPGAKTQQHNPSAVTQKPKAVNGPTLPPAPVGALTKNSGSTASQGVIKPALPNINMSDPVSSPLAGGSGGTGNTSGGGGNNGTNMGGGGGKNGGGGAGQLLQGVMQMLSSSQGGDMGLPSDSGDSNSAYGFVPSETGSGDPSSAGGVLLGVTDGTPPVANPADAQGSGQGTLGDGTATPGSATDPTVSAAIAEAAVPGAPPITSVAHSTRYLRVGNLYSKTVTLHLEYYTEDQSNKWNWVPAKPDAPDAKPLSINLEPKQFADLADGDWRINASRVRIWATSDDGKSWNQYHDQDLALVSPDENHSGIYFAPDKGVVTYIVK